MPAFAEIADIFYLGFAAGCAIICMCIGNRVSQHASILLMVQYMLANYFFEPGTVEAASTIWSMLFLGVWALVLHIAYGHFLTTALILCCLTIALWSFVALIYDLSPYLFKYVKNAIYAAEVVACLWASLGPSSSRESS